MGDIEVIDVQDTAPVVQDKEDALLMKVLETGNIEVFERFIQLRNSERALHNKEEFDFHFAKMQGEFTSAHRVKEGYGYKYAPLEELQRVYMPVIAKHGFGFTWDEEPIEDGGKRVTMTISGYKHDRRNSFDVPKGDAVVSNSGKVKQTAVQVRGVMTTYGRRYTFIAGFGVVIEDEDADGIPEGTGANYAEDATSLQSSGNLDELMASWRRIYPTIQSNPGALRYLTGIKDDKKKEFSNGR